MPPQTEGPDYTEWELLLLRKAQNQKASAANSFCGKNHSNTQSLAPKQDQEPMSFLAFPV